MLIQGTWEYSYPSSTWVGMACQWERGMKVYLIYFVEEMGVLEGSGAVFSDDVMKGLKMNLNQMRMRRKEQGSNVCP